MGFRVLGLVWGKEKKERKKEGKKERKEGKKRN